MSSSAADRGRRARRPHEIPCAGWRDIAWRVMRRLGSDNVSLVAGGLAMYSMLSIFPGLAALVFIYGLFATPADVVAHMSNFAGVLPPGVWTLFNTQLQELVHHDQGSLTVAATAGLLVALVSARSAMSSLMSATNIAYGERERRGFLTQVLISLVFTLAAIGGFLLMLTLGVAIPVGLRILGTSPWTLNVVAVLRLALLWLVALAGLALIYRYAPSRERAQWRWLTWGSVVAATLWLAASALFAFYVKAFGSYGATYGALGSVIVLLMWFYISGFIVVLGAEINSEMERQTYEDTTVRGGAPLGQRGAYAADTVGPSIGKGDPTTHEPGSERSRFSRR
jgi:membrane protein